MKENKDKPKMLAYEEKWLHNLLDKAIFYGFLLGTFFGFIIGLSI